MTTQHTPGDGFRLNRDRVSADHHRVSGMSTVGYALRTAPYEPPARFAGRSDTTRPVSRRTRPAVRTARSLVARLAIAAAATAMSAVYFWLAYHIVFEMAIGPIIGTVSLDNDWGVHSGDILALPLVALGFLTAMAGIVSVFGRMPAPGPARLRSYRPAPVSAAALS